MLCDDVSAAEATAIGLASRSVPAAEWRATIDSTVDKLCSWYCRGMAEGKVRGLGVVSTQYLHLAPKVSTSTEQATYGTVAPTNEHPGSSDAPLPPSPPLQGDLL